MPSSSAERSRILETPSSPVIPAWERAFWFFTPAGRARHHLALAHKHHEDARRMDVVEKHAAAMRHDWESLNKDEKLLLETLLYYIAWRSLATARLEKVAEALAYLDQFNPSLHSSSSLRLALMDSLITKSDANNYFAQAQFFFSDPRAAADEYTDDVLQIIDLVYTRMGADKCRNLLDHACDAIGHRKIVETATTLCSCPVIIEHEDDCRQIDASHLEFSMLMRIDAHLVNARLAECEGNVSAMLLSAEAAYQLRPEYPPAIYWLTRANLYKEPIGSGCINFLENMHFLGDLWVRIKLLVTLYQNVNIHAASALLPVLRDEVGFIGQTEARLVGRLTRLALERIHTATTAEGLCVVYDLCCAAHNKLGLLPWTQFFIAYKEVLIDQSYEAAHARLGSNVVLDYPGAQYLFRVVSIMRGAPALLPESHGKEELTLVATVMNALLVPMPRLSILDLEALLKLFSPRKLEHLTALFPATEDAIKLLWFGLRVLTGDIKGVPQELRACKLSDSSPAWVAWLHSRLCLLTEGIPPSDKAQMGGDLFHAKGERAESGSLVAAVCAKESELQSSWMSGRQALTKGSPEKAATIFNALDREIASACLLSAAWWHPLNAYWLGVAYAHARNPKAYAVLESLVGGILKDQAIGQLALLDLQEGDTTTAMQRLHGASDQVPSVRYARAVLLSRTGEPREACHLAGSEEAVSSLAGSPYAHAAKCLIAAIQERCGNQDASMRLLKEVLGAHPGDESATLRLVRHGLEFAYAKFQSDEASVDVTPYVKALAQLVPRSPAGPIQANAYALLLEVLNASAPDELTVIARKAETRTVEPVRHLWWRQLLAARFLHHGDPANARGMLATPWAASAPGAVERARAVLEIWGDLSGLTDARASAESALRLEEQVRILQRCGTGDATANRWQTLAQIGVSLIRGDTVAPERWLALGDSPMSRIPFLFDHDPQTRRIAAEALLPVLNADRSLWGEEAGLLLSALAAWAMEKDDLFIEHYTTLEPVMDKLPLTGRDLWVPAALIRYSREDWHSLAGASLPDCVADMSDPLVCLIVELADARAAIADLKNPSQTVAQRIKGIYNNLLALIERIDLQASETGVSETSTT